MKDKITAQDVLKIMLENEELRQEIERQSKAQVILDNENAELNHIINEVREYVETKKIGYGFFNIGNGTKKTILKMLDKAGETNDSTRNV